ILADACADPERRGGFVQLTSLELDEVGAVPVFRPRKDELAEPLKSQIEARDRREREEHLRLLYVAMTRAEERLFVGGALGAAGRAAADPPARPFGDRRGRARRAAAVAGDAGRGAARPVAAQPVRAAARSCPRATPGAGRGVARA